ncbi:ribbon-helix-helix domain-containing protein [Aetokthonos hydrillicola Thurmond2011]|uniref:Ribbon-helix-helix domain-containing protein n=1 Tax=Aetokthonos hydrillicola Thurmond2011 TaxID=2712845 RepID=A0AAP5M8U7_9CYAN|nr:ribbon-helix-helix domain-containing protein [Aetokthonos hydrillicola]MBW4590811.1 ribbon-helix-helix domain-containing protein [Aetokthonos hydrillicola CCALA 1050]MDR9893644.1 ribbon-helix-helix domain-containing protein [Aetokthonos hydrillicola Thurmond2011]
MIHWSVTVSDETNKALRQFLAEHGDNDLSKFIEKAVQEKIFRATVQEVHERNLAFDSEEIDSAIDEAVSAVRAAHRS